MADSSRNIQQNNRKRPLSFTTKCVWIGFWGGLIVSTFGYFGYLLNFTSFGPALVLSPLSSDTAPSGQIAGIFIISVLSIFVALVYKWVLAKLYSMWIGVLYGAAIWCIIFFLARPIFPHLKPVGEWDENTFVTIVCLYILYGLFIGYSICFEYNELNTPGQEKSEKNPEQEVNGS